MIILLSKTVEYAIECKTLLCYGFRNKCVRERMDARLNAMFMQREYFSLLSAAYNAPQHLPELATTYSNKINHIYLLKNLLIIAKKYSFRVGIKYWDIYIKIKWAVHQCRTKQLAYCCHLRMLTHLSNLCF